MHVGACETGDGISQREREGGGGFTLVCVGMRPSALEPSVWMLLSLAPISLASQSQSWTEDRLKTAGRGGWEEGNVNLHYPPPHSSTPYWIYPRGVGFCGLEGLEQSLRRSLPD